MISYPMIPEENPRSIKFNYWFNAYPVDERLRSLARSLFDFELVNGFLILLPLDGTYSRTCVAFCNTKFTPKQPGEVPEGYDKSYFHGLAGYSITAISRWFCLELGQFVEQVHQTDIEFPYSTSEMEDVLESRSAQFIPNVEDCYVPTMVWLWLLTWSTVNLSYCEKVIYEYSTHHRIVEIPYDLCTERSGLNIYELTRGMSPYTYHIVSQIILRVSFVKAAINYRRPHNVRFTDLVYELTKQRFYIS